MNGENTNTEGRSGETEGKSGKKGNKGLLLAAGAVIVAAAVIVGVLFSGKSGQYRDAARAEQAGDLAGAYRIYAELGDYKDAPEKLQALEERMPSLKFSAAEENDIVRFGTFEQDGNADNGQEPLEWIVLDRREDRELLLSRFVIAAMPYNQKNADLTWEECSLRAWLNKEFIEMTFAEPERALLLEVENKNDGNKVFETLGGNNTMDTVFLISREEASAYFHEEDLRLMNGRGEPTQSAVNEGISVIQGEGNEAIEAAGGGGSAGAGFSPWWLRGPGVYQNSAAFVETDGTVYESGAILDNPTFCGVRPAVWVKVK